MRHDEGRCGNLEEIPTEGPARSSESGVPLRAAFRRLPPLARFSESPYAGTLMFLQAMPPDFAGRSFDRPATEPEERIELRVSKYPEEL